MENPYFVNRTTRALIVDDDVFAQNYIERLLDMTGVQHIHKAKDGGEALNLLRGIDVDVVLLDINMEPVNGLEFLKAVRTGKAGVRRDLPVIVLTSIGGERMLGSVLAFDCDGFLLKPSSQHEVAEKIWSALVPGESIIRAPQAYQVIPTNLTENLNDTVLQEEPLPDHAIAVRWDELEPGNVLARDIRTFRGNTLLTAGTSLTQHLISRLGELSDLAGFEFIAIEDTTYVQGLQQAG